MSGPWLAFLGAAIIGVPLFADATLNPAAVDPSQFRVTTFTSNLMLANSVVPLEDGSLLIAYSPDWANGTIARFVDANYDGEADAPGKVVYRTTEGPITQMRQAGNYIYVGEFGGSAIRLLRPGATPVSELTSAGALRFAYPEGWQHPTIGMVLRPAPGAEASYDLIFNVGSQYNAKPTIGKVGLSGLGLPETLLDG